jgi:hypothetical protein
MGERWPRGIRDRSPDGWHPGAVSSVRDTSATALDDTEQRAKQPGHCSLRMRLEHKQGARREPIGASARDDQQARGARLLLLDDEGSSVSPSSRAAARY